MGDLLPEEIKQDAILVSPDEEKELVRRYNKVYPQYFPHEGALRYIPLADDAISKWQPVAAWEFWQEITKGNLEDDALLLVMWDSYDLPTIRLTAAAFRRHFETLYSLPMHMHVLPEDLRWCVVYTMEGSMAFGIAHSESE